MIVAHPTMISGVHAIIFTRDADAVRVFLQDVLEFPSVDAGEGWPIFALPPAELAAHATDDAGHHEIYLMCDDIETFVTGMRKRGIACGAVHDEGWGLLTQVMLPGGGKLGVYQPRHARPPG